MEFNVLPDEALTDPEIANAFEAGFKGRFGEKFDLYIAAFLTKLDDFQQNATIPEVFPSRTVLQNIGDVRSAGVETDIGFQVTDQLSLSGSVTYLDSKYTSGVFNCYSGQTAALGCNVANGSQTLQSLDGLQTDLSPKWKYRLEGNYNRSITNSLDGYANLAWMEQTGMNFDSNQDPNNYLVGGYGLLDFAVGVASKTGRYTVEIFGKNILDKWYPATLGNAPPYGLQDFGPSRGQEAYYGMRVRINLL
jgi:iron complex outermembrane receptor protein